MVTARSLQRDAFDLRDDEPHPDAQRELRVVVRDGRGGPEVVSCLTLLQQTLCVRGAEMAMGGVRHVATRPEAQNQGYAGALMRDTLRAMRAQKIPGSVLFPFSFRYYRKFGYELGGNYCQFWCRPNCLPAFAERQRCRSAEPGDLEALAALDRARAWNRTFSLMRDRSRWEEIEHDPTRTVTLFPGPTWIEGYMVRMETRDHYGGRVLRLLDLAAGTTAAWRGLLGCLSQSPVESIEWCASATDLGVSGLLRSPAPLREGFKPRAIATVRPFFQFRVVHLEAALRALLPTQAPGAAALALQVRDEVLPENSVPLAIRGTPAGAVLTPPEPADPVLSADIRVFSQLYCGYMSPTEAVSQGLAEVSCPRALETAEALFPVGEPFIPELDRF